jgi:branched-chain amino acid transport system substrate-binding protein
LYLAEKKTEEKKVSRRKFIAAAGVGAVAVAAAGTGAYYYFGGPKQAAKESITVGYAQPLTGPLAPAATDCVNYYKQWADQKNAEGGLKAGDLRLPVKLIFYDTQGDAAICVKVYERLMAEDKVDLILPPWGTFEHFAIIPLLAKYGYPVVANLADTDKVTELSEPIYYFQAWRHYTEALSIVQAVKANADKVTGGAKRNIAVAVPYLQSMGPAETGTDIIKICVELGGFDVVLEKAYPEGVTDLTPLLLQVKDAKPDAILGGTYPPDFDLMLQQMIANKVDANVVYGWVGPFYDYLLKKYGDNMQGISALGGAGYSVHDPKMKPFTDQYIKMFGYSPAMGDYGLAVTGNQILEQAVAIAGLDHEKIRQQLLNATFDTIMGPIAFHGKAFPAEEQYQHDGTLQWQNGVLEVVWHLPKPDRTTAPFMIPKPPWR